jgi:hypothetical protein
MSSPTAALTPPLEPSKLCPQLAQKRAPNGLPENWQALQIAAGESAKDVSPMPDYAALCSQRAILRTDFEFVEF